MTRMVCGLVLILCGISAVPVFAQSQGTPSSGPVGPFGELWTKLKSGDTIYVLDANARETSGIFAEASESSIKLLVEGQVREIPASNVRRLARRGDPLWNGALIGAAFGAVGGAFPAKSDVCSADMYGFYGNCVITAKDRALSSLAGAVVFGAVGAGIDALIHGRTVVYGATPLGTLEQSRELPEGTRVRVTGPDDVRRRQTGNILTMDEKTLTIIDRAGQHVKIPRERVTRLDVSSGKKGNALGGLLIGAVGGALLGLTSGTESCEWFCPSPGEVAAVTGAFFGGIGAGVGHFVKTEKWVKMPLDRVYVGLRPGRSGQGGSLSLTVAF
jgi:hypothetical protein